MAKTTFKITATIPTTQYGNLQPEIEAEGNTYEEAQELALGRMSELWNRVCEAGRELKIGQKAVVPTATNSYDEVSSELTGTTLLFDKVAHKYTDADGEDYLSGSVFAGNYKSKFDIEAVSAGFAKKHGVAQDDVKAMWTLNGTTSTSLGTAVHNALELYGKYLQLSMKTKGTNESALHKSDVLRPIVESFFKGREDEDAMYEAFVADKELRLCGFIDRLLIVDRNKKVCRIQDYKTNSDINKAETILPPFRDIVPRTTLGSYWLQLSFYAFILQRHGWTVEGLDIFSLEGGEWKTYTHDVVDVSGELVKRSKNG